VRGALLAALCVCAFTAGAAPAKFVIEAEIAPKSVYVGAETVLRQRLLRVPPSAAYGVLRAPDLRDIAEVWPVEQVRWSEARRDDALWQVHERAYVVVPLRPGRLVVPGAELEGPLRRAHAAGLALGATRGPRLALEVRERPPNAGEPWLPARRVLLEESWSRDPASLSVGTPVTRTVVLLAHGIPAQRLPQLEMPAYPALRVHHDRAELATEYSADGTTGRVVQRIVLVPLDEGEVALPALSVSWWDVQADAARVATLPARTLVLRPAPAAAPLAAVKDVSPQNLLRTAAAALAVALAAWLWWHALSYEWSEAYRQLRAACRRSDARAARDALLQWHRLVSRATAPSLVRSVGAGWDASARAQLGALDAALYGRRAWDGKEFWRRVRPWLRKAASQRVAPAARQAPFFRLQAADPTGDDAIARQ
jgi:hypothetical protein